MSEQTESKLIYGFDPLCGWCYGFLPEMDEVRRAHPDMPVELKMGGLVMGSRVGPIAESREYLRRGIAEVGKRARVEFGEAFEALMEEGTYISDSEPPCRAIWTMQQLVTGDHPADFAADLCRAFYRDGRRPDDPDLLCTLARKHGADPEAFLALWDTEQGRRGAAEAMEEARHEGISMYPTLMIEQMGVRQTILRGYARAEHVLATLDEVQILEEAPAIT